MESYEQQKRIWTIGHSTRSSNELIALLESFEISLLADIRRFPGSRRYPQFNKEALQASLKTAHIGYIHFASLGGRRKPVPDSVNTAWHNAAFKGYADYMETTEFKTSIEDLEKLAAFQRTAYMCSEAVWWRCHRSLVSDYLKVNGWMVVHIMAVGKGTEHHYTTPAHPVQGRLFYNEGNKE